jgi:hypothetical protein
MINQLSKNNIIVGGSTNGKTTLALNIAIFLKSINKRVLYVDTNNGIYSILPTIKSDISDLHILQTSDLSYLSELVNLTNKINFDWVIIDNYTNAREKEYLWDVIGRCNVIMIANNRKEFSVDYGSFRTFTIKKTGELGKRVFKVYNNELPIFEFDQDDIRKDMLFDILAVHHLSDKRNGLFAT